MKLTTILLFAALLQVSAAGFAQRITFTQKNASLKQVFKEINKQTGYSVFWSPQLVKNVKAQDVSFNNTPLNEVLDICFKNLSLTYLIEDKNVIIKEKTSSAAVQAVMVKGKITDEKGLPIPGAGVTLKGSSTATSTDM
ncbi:MAG TPA: secretin and TonB N-terminal domain-containing protein, partial [Pedobacter sp.]